VSFDPKSDRGLSVKKWEITESTHLIKLRSERAKNLGTPWV